VSAVLRCLFKGEFTGSTYHHKSALELLFFRLDKWYRKRQASKKLIKQQNEFGIYKNSIIVDYFLKKKHLFTDLPFEEKNIL
jgi:hypothetical protein